MIVLVLVVVLALVVEDDDEDEWEVGRSEALPRWSFTVWLAYTGAGSYSLGGWVCG